MTKLVDVETRGCEICDPETMHRVPTDVVRVRIADRVVAFCPEHAEKVREALPESLDDLRRLFAEHLGSRSLLDRRSPLDRRIFPPRPEGRRRGRSRRDG